MIKDERVEFERMKEGAKTYKVSSPLRRMTERNKKQKRKTSLMTSTLQKVPSKVSSLKSVACT